MLFRDEHRPSVKTPIHWLQRWRKLPERLAGGAPRPACTSAGLSAEELRRLTALRERLLANPSLAALDLEDPAREFARWLVTQGKLNEGLPAGVRD